MEEERVCGSYVALDVEAVDRFAGTAVDTRGALRALANFALFALLG